MPLFGLIVLYKDATEARILKSEFDLSNFSYFQRSTVKELMIFTSRTLINRLNLDSKATVTEGEYLAHAYVRRDRLSAVLFSSQDYQRRVAHSLLVKVLLEFERECPSTKWYTGTEETIAFTKLAQMLSQYQVPENVDSIMRVQQDLDETKIILHRTLESLLDRGEKLDDLIVRSNDLGAQSKLFYHTAKKTNRCCHM
ncbi:hypothetical protein GJ496_007360 [Pomphorhynchus laevis]|nr:hypothetical protein GJ496_007360 [Pomphorhynchus laevis]